MPVVANPRTELALIALEEALIATHGDLKNACKSIQCSQIDLQNWMRADPEVAQRVRQAQQHGWATLENVAYERAVNGIEEPVYQKGELVGTKMVYSDTLLAKMLAARVPGYGETTHNHNHNFNVSIMPRASSYEEWCKQRDIQLLPSPSEPAGEIEDAEFTPLPSPDSDDEV